MPYEHEEKEKGSFGDKQTFKRHVIENSILNLFGRILGIAIPLLIALWFGSTSQTDAFFLAYSLAFFGIAITNNLFETLLVPFVAEQSKNRTELGPQVSWLILLATASLSIGLLSVDSVLPTFLSYTAHFPTEEKLLVRKFLRDFYPVIFLVLWNATLSGVLNYYRLFRVSAFGTVIRAFGAISVLVALHDKLGLEAVAYGYFFGEAARLLWNGFFVARRVLRGLPIFSKRTSLKAVREFFAQLLPQTLGLVFVNLIGPTDHLMAGWAMQVGAISFFAYAERCYLIGYFIFAGGIVPVIFSYWAHAAQQKGHEGLDWLKAKRTIFQNGLFACVLIIILVFVGRPLLEFFFLQGRMQEEEIEIVFRLLRWMLLGLPAHVVTLLCIRLLILFHCHKFYMAASGLRWVLDAVLNWGLLITIGLEGIAFSTTVVNVLMAGIFLWKVRSLLNGQTHQGARQ